MNKQENTLLPPNPKERVSELTPWRLQKQAAAIGMKMIDGTKEAEGLSPEQVNESYRTIKMKMAEDILHNRSVDGLTTTSPLRFEFATPVQTINGETVESDTWKFCPTQYLGSLSGGVYSISRYRDKLQAHDALHAAELATIQKHAPGVSQLMIDSATFALDSSDEIQKEITGLLDMFTDTFALDNDASIRAFEWRSADILRIMNPKLSHEDLERIAKGLSLEAVSGIRKFVEENMPQD